ncbi:MAG: hypothetical protein E7348_03195 [Clostridiales bacterium]|nr:hypothetical protein [Clostridiales bacterium]
MNNNCAKKMKKPHRFSFFNVLLFVVLYVIISVSLIILVNLIVVDGFGNFAVATGNMFDKIGLGKVWDCIYKFFLKLF